MIDTNGSVSFFCRFQLHSHYKSTIYRLSVTQSKNTASLDDRYILPSLSKREEKKKIEKRVAKRHQPNQAASMLTESWVSDIVSPWKRWKEKRRERHGAQGQLQLDNRNRLGCLSSSKQRTRKLRDYRYLLEYVHTITVTIIISVSHLLSKWKGQISKT